MGQSCDLCPVNSFSSYKVTSGHRVPRLLLSQDWVKDGCGGTEAVSRCELCILCFSSPCSLLRRAGSLKESRAEPGEDVQHRWGDAHELQLVLEITLVLPVLSEVLGLRGLLPFSSFGCLFFCFAAK